MFDTLSVSEVESELVGMAGHLAAGTCRFLQLLAEFDTRQGWAGPGLRSCAHWLNWRVGMDERTARDHLRVAHALTELPATTAAFAAGRISYSKARALTRIATADNEDVLLNVALHGTAAQLDDLARAARAGSDPRTAAARRGLHYTREADGSLLVRLRIPAERGEHLLAAIQAELDADHTADHTAASGGSAEPPATQTGPAAHHHRHAEHAELTARAAEHAPGPVLEPLAARRLDALLDLVAGDRHADPATLVVHLRLDDLDPAPVATEHPAPVPDPAPPTPLRPVAWIENGPAIPVPVAERLTCTGAVQALLVDRKGNPLHLRVATRAQLRALRVRDGNTCAFPGCTHTRHLEAHHVRWWRHDGRTDLDNLLRICGFHHTLIHDHGYRVTPTDDGTFTFARPDRTPIPAAGPPPAGSADHLVAAHTTLAIDGWTITPRWGGERLDPNPILRWLVPELRAARAA